MASAEREPITGSGGRAPGGVQGRIGPWWGAMEQGPHEAEDFSDLRRRKEAANLPSSCVLAT